MTDFDDLAPLEGQAYGQWNDSPPTLGEANCVIYPKKDGGVIFTVNGQDILCSFTIRGNNPINTAQLFMDTMAELLTSGHVRIDPTFGAANFNYRAPEASQQGPAPATLAPPPSSGAIDYTWPAGYEWQPLGKDVAEGLAKGLQVGKAGNDKTRNQQVRYVAGVRPFARDGKISLQFVNSEGMEIFKFYDNSTTPEDNWKNPLDASKHWVEALTDTIRDVARRSPGKIVRFNGFVAYTQKRKDDGTLYPPTFSRIHFADESNVEWQVVNQ